MRWVLTSMPPLQAQPEPAATSRVVQRKALSPVTWPTLPPLPDLRKIDDVLQACWHLGYMQPARRTCESALALDPPLGQVHAEIDGVAEQAGAQAGDAQGGQPSVHPE